MGKFIKVVEKIVEIALYGLVFSIPFSKAAIEVFGITAIAGWVVLGLIRFARNDKGSTPLLWALDCFGLRPRNDRRLALVIFLTANLISCITSVAIGHSISAFFTKTLEYTLFFIIIASVFSDYKKLKILLMVMLVSVTFAYINAMVQYFTGFDLIRRDPVRDGIISGSLINPNDFGSYVIMFMPLLLSLAIWKKLILRYRIAIISVFLMSLFSLIFSYSRGALVGFTAGILFFSFVKSKKLFFSFLVVLMAGFFILPVRMQDRITSTLNLENLQSENRTTLWKEAFSVIKDHPITGAGLNTYSMIAPKYKRADFGGGYPHNSYLQMAAEIGLVGLMAFLWFLYTLFIRGFRLAVRRAHGTPSDISSSVASLMTGCTLASTLLLGIMAGIIGFSVNAFFDTTLFALRLVTLFWVMAGVLVALCNIAEDQYNKSTKT